MVDHGGRVATFGSQRKNCEGPGMYQITGHGGHSDQVTEMVKMEVMAVMGHNGKRCDPGELGECAGPGNCEGNETHLMILC